MQPDYELCGNNHSNPYVIHAEEVVISLQLHKIVEGPIVLHASYEIDSSSNAGEC